MSIQIEVSDIVKLEKDAIVNAANERLAQGSGVCGAIFSAAGPYEMNKACKVVGGCPTGDAVITSGFNLPSRYVIHAVGPKWNGGNHNEPSLLYGAYENSLKLALRYDLRTIAFPLISAGIYGYPVEKAWRVALKACIDFNESHKDHELDITFAVLDSDNQKLGRTILYELLSLRGSKVVKFHNPDEENGFLSNWYMSNFTVDGITYSSMEQYMMHKKAVLFKDENIAKKILSITDVSEIKNLGRQVSGFDNVIWNGMRQIIVYNGLLAKYSQNSTLKEMLLATEDKILVECASNDIIWANGLIINDPKCSDITFWKGQNLLGFATMLVRDELRKSN